MRQDQLLSLIINRLDGKLTDENQEELNAWLAEAPANKVWFDQLLNEETLQYEIQQWRAIDPAKGYAQWRSSIDTRRASRIRKIGWSVAASLLIVASVIGIRKGVLKIEPASIPVTSTPVVLPGKSKVLLTLSNGEKISLDSARTGDVALQGNVRLVKKDSGTLSYVQTGGEKAAAETFNTVTTLRSSQYEVILPDGSHVWLNNLSSLRYPTSFKGNNRTVELTGEGYFEIAKNTAKPFVVKVNGEAVEVLGTSFNIMGYSDEGTTQTTLLTGAVQVKAGGAGVRLQPEEQAEWKGNGDFTVLKNVPAEDIISWKNGFFYFGRASFKEVMRQLARWYDVDVRYEGAVPDLEFGGKIDRNLSLNELLKYLDKNQVHFRLDGRTLIVLPS